jgi:NitT/TauT family transport system substrate-binding protein
MADPGAAVEAAAEIKPGINKAILKAQLAASLKLVPPPDGSQMTFGAAPAAYWEQTLAILKQYQGLKTEAATADHYSYEHLPKP